MGEIWPFLFIYTHFGNSLTGQTRRRIFARDGSNDADSRKDVSFWGFVDIAQVKFLTVGRLKRAELRHRAKFGRNRQKRGDFSIFQDGGRPPSWIRYVCVRTTHEGHWVVFIAVQNLVGIDAAVLIICMFFNFKSLALKRLFTFSKLGFWPIPQNPNFGA